MRQWLAPMVAVLCLAGCVSGPMAPDDSDPGPDTCGTAGMQGLVGQDRSVLAAMTLPEGTRVIRPGQPVTTDYSPQRLNIDLDARGRIVRLWCG